MKKMWRKGASFVLALAVAVGAFPGTLQVQAETTLISETVEISGEERYDADYYAEPELRFPEKQKSLYSQAGVTLSLEEYVVAALENHEKFIDVSAYNISIPAAGREYFKILNDNPQLFYVLGGVSLTNTGNQVKYYWPEYLAGKEEVSRMKEELETAAQQVLEQVDESMDAVQKALVVHDYLVQNCEYDQEHFMAGTVPDISHTAYGALVNGMAVCDGYANAYAYIMEHKLGIPCTVVSSERMKHAWNMIEIDGKWYHADLTYDDPAWDCIGRVCHNYFLLSDQEISSKEHCEWTPGHAAGDTHYDKAFWIGVESAISYYNGAWYYSGYDPGTHAVVLKKKEDLSAADATTVCRTSPWQASGQSSYQGSFMYLAQANGKLYFSTNTAIMQMDADGGIQVFYEPDDLAGKQIFGFTVKDGWFLYAPNATYPSDKQSDIRRYWPGGETPPSEDPDDDPPETPEDPDAAFWAYVEEQRQELQEYKDAVIAELNDYYAPKVGSYHYTPFNDDLNKLIADAIDEINRVEIAWYSDGFGYNRIERSFRACVESIQVNLTRRKAKIDEQVNLFDWSDLVDVWKAAKEELDNYKNPNDYRPAQQKELQDAIEAGKAAIDEAKKAAYVDGNPTSHDPVSAKKDVQETLKAAKANIDKIKTDAQLKKEENGEKEDKNNNTKPTPAAMGEKLTVTDQQCTVKVTSADKENPQVAYIGTTNKKATQVKVPDTVSVKGVTYKVTSIADKAFYKNKKIKTVTVGKNVTSIGKGAFQNCTSLQTVTIKSTALNKIGANAFNGDKKLMKITLKTTKLTKNSIGKNVLKGTNKKLIIKVPGNKVSAYKSYFQNKGNKNVKIKK